METEIVEAAKIDPQILGGLIAAGAAISAAILTVIIGYWAVVLHDGRRRKEEKADIARTLLQELADRAARCAFDFHNTWARYGVPDIMLERIDSTRLQKFLAIEPIIYPTVGAKLSLLNPEIGSTLIHFYYRLSAWNRDLSFRIQVMTGPLTAKQHIELSTRLGETLRPAIAAIDALSKEVSDSDDIGRTALATYYQPGDLRSFLREQLSAARQPNAQ